MTDAHKFGLHVKQQAPGRRRYVEHGGKLCSRCLTNPPVKNHGYRKGCKAIYEKAHRASAKDLGVNNKLSKGIDNDQLQCREGGQVPASKPGP